MGVIGKQRDQGKEQGGKNRDPALTVKYQNHRSEPKRRIVQANYRGIREITERPSGVLPVARQRVSRRASRSSLRRSPGTAVAERKVMILELIIPIDHPDQ